MGRMCSVCEHESRMAIDEAMARGDSLASLSRTHGVTISSLWRHQQSHLPEAVAKSAKAQQAVHGDTLFEQLQALQQEVLDVLQEAKASGKHSLILQAVEQQRRLMDLNAKLHLEVRRALMDASEIERFMTTVIEIMEQECPQDARERIVRRLNEAKIQTI